ncbi:MAG: acyl-CoA dehydrogenase family protein [Hyphomonadaceae bacterium]|nr:acyl-CoA dehydrogenase family protein [Hyphomonadaceae bacterium]
MRIISSAGGDRFREEVREWVVANRPKEKRPLEGEAMAAYDKAWQRTQYEAGWAGIAWPKEYGGRGLALLEQVIWFEEYSRAGAPVLGCNFIGLSHAGPTLIVAGTQAQKQFHLPRILKGEEVWCQGFSEPGSGSDLASLSTHAEIDGDHLVVNGSKIWTSYGLWADYQELLVRTDRNAPKHKGISWVICDMSAQGITTRPIKAMSGITHFCQVFYDNVRIPLTSMVGEINDGWSVAMTTLGFERGTATLGHQIDLSETVDDLIEIARVVPAPGGRGRKAIQDDSIADQLAQLKAEVLALRSLSMLSASRAMREEVPGAEGNIVALFFCELAKRVYAFAIDMLGPEGMEKAERDWPLAYLEHFKYSIGGGTSEIRRNVIGERVLGLPKGKK